MCTRPNLACDWPGVTRGLYVLYTLLDSEKIVVGEGT